MLHHDSSTPSDPGQQSLKFWFDRRSLSEIADEIDQFSRCPDPRFQRILWGRLRAIAHSLREREQTA